MGGIFSHEDNDEDYFGDIGFHETSEVDFDVSEQSVSFIQFFHAHSIYDAMIQVPLAFIEDGFNLFHVAEGIGTEDVDYDLAVELIRSVKTEKYYHGLYHSEENSKLMIVAMTIYGLIHARYILTEEGQRVMAHLINERHYGTCGRVLCERNPLIPTGLSDTPYQLSSALYCSKCEEIYLPKQDDPLAKLDGAFFGSTFANLLLLSPNINSMLECHVPQSSNTIQRFEPRCFGFKVFKGDTSKLGPSRVYSFDKNGDADKQFEDTEPIILEDTTSENDSNDVESELEDSDSSVPNHNNLHVNVDESGVTNGSTIDSTLTSTGLETNISTAQQ